MVGQTLDAIGQGRVEHRRRYRRRIALTLEKTNAVTVARELAPAGSRSGPQLFVQKTGTAAQSSGSKLPRHR
ncbi:hypothetical protein DBR46_26735 [Pseudomonas sp. KBW05]|nr:hypothetical protein DBR46_26735 [Pseudomonas sp. KBW05]